MSMSFLHDLPDCQVDIATYVTEYVGDRPYNTIFKNAAGQHSVNGTYSNEEYLTKAMFNDLLT